MSYVQQVKVLCYRLKGTLGYLGYDPIPAPMTRLTTAAVASNELIRERQRLFVRDPAGHKGPTWVLIE